MSELTGPDVMGQSFQFYVAHLSLMDEYGEPNDAYIEQHLNWLCEQGVQGILVGGSNGEFPHFSVIQRQRILAHVIGNNPGLDVIVNVGACAWHDTQSLINHAQHYDDVSYLMWMPPFYYEQHQLNGLVDNIEAVLEQITTDKPLLLYHYPQLSGVDITPDILRTCPDVAGIKDSSGDTGRISQLVDEFTDRVFYMGTDVQVSFAQEVGCDGLISGLGNLFPKLYVDAINQPNRDLESTLQTLRDICSRYPKIPSFKAVLNRFGWKDCEPTWPIYPMSALDESVTDQLVNELVLVLKERGYDDHPLCVTQASSLGSA